MCNFNIIEVCFIGRKYTVYSLQNYNTKENVYIQLIHYIHILSVGVRYIQHEVINCTNTIHNRQWI